VLLPAEAGIGRDVRDRRPLGHLGEHLVDEVPGPHEVHEHHVDVRERRSGQSCAGEERVDGRPDPGGAGLDGCAVAEVDLEEVGDVDGGRLDVDADHLGAEPDKYPGRRLAHPGCRPRDDHPPPVVTQDVVHAVPL
jgi:hypothetical protein